MTASLPVERSHAHAREQAAVLRRSFIVRPISRSCRVGLRLETWKDAPAVMATIEQFAQRQTQPQDRAYRTPPQNIEAEQALLGAILINNDAFDRVSDFLKSEHFSAEIHRRIYEIASSLIRAGKHASPITLK